LSRSASYCFSFFTFARLFGIDGLLRSLWLRTTLSTSDENNPE
jgi:hypothetical protein